MYHYSKRTEIYVKWTESYVRFSDDNIMKTEKLKKKNPTWPKEKERTTRLQTDRKSITSSGEKRS